MQKQDFNLVRGDDISYRLLLLQADKTPLDLKGTRFDLHARIEEEDAPVIALSSEARSIEILTEGRIVLHFTHAMTQSAEWDRANYDLQLQKDGKRTTLLYGKIKLIADQTRI